MKIRINDRLMANRTVKLHWFGNVRQTSNNNWRIRVGFQFQDELFSIDRPLATLPLLRIGEAYHDGFPLSSQKSADLIDTITISVKSRAWSSKALQVCRVFNYYLYRHPEFINQRMYSIVSSGRVVHIPYVELIRALFALHKPLSNAMLYPNGLAFIIDRYSRVNSILDIQFSEVVAASSLTEDFVHHVAWIISNKDVMRSYESIFSKVHSEYHPQFGTPLSFVPPHLDNVTIQFRGLKSGNEILVLEVLGIGGLDLDVEKIIFRHPYIKERTFEPGHKKGRRIKRPDDEGIDIIDEIPKIDTNQPILSHEPTVIEYNRRVELVRVAGKFQVVHQGEGYFERKGKGGASSLASVSESIVGGKTQPIDVQSLDVTNGASSGELCEFLEMVRRLRDQNPDLLIDISIVDLPSGRQFAYLPNGVRRKCAVVRVQRSGRFAYILEVSRQDGHSLSTLMFYATSDNLKSNNDTINGLLHNLVYNQGHWKLRNISIQTHLIRHTHSNIDEWVRKITRLINW